MTIDQAVSLSDAQMTGLVEAYVERKRFESKVLISVLGEALKPQKESMSLAKLESIGFKIEGF